MTTHRPPPRSLAAPRVIALVAIAPLAAGCASRRPAPIDDRTASPAPIVVPGGSAPATIAPPAAAPRPVPDVAAPPPTYVVKRGDTLRQIANDHGLDWRELAAWNGIENSNVIRVGQTLRLTAPGSETAAVAGNAAASGTTVTPLRSAPPLAAGDSRAPVAAAPPAAPQRPGDAMTRTGPKAVKEPWSEQAVRDVARSGAGIDAAVVARADTAVRPVMPPAATPSTPPATPPTPSTSASASPPPTASAAPAPSPGDDEGLDWVWPAKGKLVAQFSENASLKGIDIAGGNGDAILASAPGRVVYAGSGLRGYGKLVIIKHNATYLTAYAHNRDILVKEGQAVTRGQKIAEMGSTDADRVKLHFEIRRLGKPMDPLRFLPPA